MISRPRVPRVRRSTIILVVAIAALAFPLGVLANHQFDDVPTGASYHDDVEALVAAGITSGCGGNNYCPGSPVTRGQMAQFLNRLGDLDGSFSPSVNADTVDDIHAVNLMPGGDPPFGMTIRGVFAVNGADGQNVQESFSFGYELSQSPTPHYITSGAVPPAGCPGTSTNPEADPGHLCVYEDTVVGNPSFDCIFNTTTDACSATTRWGWGISQLGSGSVWYTSGTWAVTEPLTLIVPLSEEPQQGDGRSASDPTE